MKILGKTLAVCMLSACICLLCVGMASAKVCFVGDEGCAGGADFGDAYTDDSENLCQDVKDASGNAMYRKAPCPDKSHVSAVCPYNASYVQCCGDSFAYSTCPYPLESVGRCGNSYKCACPKEKFPYASCPSPTIPGGINCLQIDDDSKTTSIHYEKCVCDSGLYPYKQNSDCDDNQIVDTRRACTDTDGVTQYYRCKCPDSWSTCASMDGKGAVGAKKCYSDGNTYHSQCCECPGFERSMNDPYATDYEYCLCNNNFRKASGCQFGYKVQDGHCVEMTCGDALEALFNSSSSYASYGLYTGTAKSQKTLVVGDDVSGPWSHFEGKSVMSGAAFVKNLTGSNNYIRNVQTKCTNSVPKISISYSSSMTTNGTLDFTSVILYASSSWWSKNNFTCTNCSLDLFAWYNEGSGSTKLVYNASLPNSDRTYVDAYKIDISKPYTSDRYNYNVTSGGVNINTPNDDKVVLFKGYSTGNRMTFRSDSFTVKGLASFQNANVYVKKAIIGNTHTGDYGYDNKTFVSLYYTNWYLSENSQNYTMYIYSKTGIGVPCGASNHRCITCNYGSRIITENGTQYCGIRFYHDRHQGAEDHGVKFINQSGTITNYPSIEFFCEKTSHNSHDNPGTVYYLNGLNQWERIRCNGKSKYCGGADRPTL